MKEKEMKRCSMRMMGRERISHQKKHRINETEAVF